LTFVKKRYDKRTVLGRYGCKVSSNHFFTGSVLFGAGY
jgi:hypothetical protein